MLLLGMDLETSWTLNTKLSRITEIGAILLDTEEGKPLEIYSQLVWDDSYPESPKELVELTGITDKMLRERGEIPEVAFRRLTSLMNEADYIVAHNGSGFDRPVYVNEMQRFNMPVVDKPWIDTRTDIPYPSHIKQRSLTYLAADHGFLNPFAHRAIFDVLTMMKVLSHYDLDEVIKISKYPLVHAIAKVSFNDKDLAKARGYYWNGENKIWFKPMKECFLEDERNAAPFIVGVVYPPEEV